VFLLCRLTSGAFTIDSSTPTLRRNLNEHPIFLNLSVVSIGRMEKGNKSA
jgi:hypothetical protein